MIKNIPKKIKKIAGLCLILLTLTLLHSECKAEMRCDDFSGSVGDVIALRIEVDSLKKGDDLTFTLHIANPTVFYFDSLRTSQAGLDFKYSIYQLDYQNIEFRIQINESLSDTTRFEMYGELLAGSTSKTMLYFLDVTVNKQVIGDISITIDTGNDVLLTYARPLKIDNNYPNPVQRFQETTWKYYLDQPTDLVITIYDNLGKIILFHEEHIGNRGVFEFNFTPEDKIDTGVYYFTIDSNFGTVTKKFVVMN